MEWKTATGKIKNIPMHKYLVDWDGDQGSAFSEDVLDFLHTYWKNDIVCAEVPVAGTKMRYDYVNVSKKIICETDGAQHDKFISGHFHRTREDYKAQIKRDMLKDELAQKNGFKMIRIKPTDLPLTKEWLEETFEIKL